jgi:hypothetical protein
LPRLSHNSGFGCIFFFSMFLFYHTIDEKATQAIQSGGNWLGTVPKTVSGAFCATSSEMYAL